MDSSLSIVVPCYNEAENIPGFFPGLLSFAGERGYRVVAVNDGSSDRTLEILTRLKETAPHLDIISHKLNRGYGAAIKTGLHAVETEYAITIDADGQHRLEDVDKCFRAIVETDSDLVVGARANNASGMYRSLGKWGIRMFASMLFELPVKDLNSGMKCYRMSETVSYLDLCPDTMAFSDVILLLMVLPACVIHTEALSLQLFLFLLQKKTDVSMHLENRCLLRPASLLQNMILKLWALNG